MMYDAVANVEPAPAVPLKAAYISESATAAADSGLEPSIIYACTYTDISVLAHTPEGEHGAGIYALSFCPKTGSLARLSQTSVSPNPAFLVQHPRHKNIVYGTTEQIQGDGHIVTYRVAPGGALEVVASVPAAGRSTCYINIHESCESLIAVNYWDAKTCTFAMADDGTVAEVPSDVAMQPGAQYVIDNKPGRDEHWCYRQRWPHSHCCVTEPYSKRYSFVTDLGLDSVFVYEWEHATGKLNEKCQVKLEAGRGPRHIVFHPTLKTAYISNELDSTVTALKYNPKVYNGEGTVVESLQDEGATLEHMQCLSSLPESWQNTGKVHDNGVWKAASHSAELHIHPTGKFLYVANRGHDSIAVYAIHPADGSISLVEIKPSGGKCPRNFNFDVTGRWIIVGNQNSNNLTSFRINEGTGALTLACQVDMPLPNYVFSLPASVATAAAINASEE